MSCGGSWPRAHSSRALALPLCVSPGAAQPPHRNQEPMASAQDCDTKECPECLALHGGVSFLFSGQARPETASALCSHLSTGEQFRDFFCPHHFLFFFTGIL